MQDTAMFLSKFRKNQKNTIFIVKFLHISEICCTFAVEIEK